LNSLVPLPKKEDPNMFQIIPPMPIRILFIALLFLFQNVEAQQQEPGMNLGLHRRLLENPDSPRLISALIKGEASCVAEQTTLYGGKVIVVAGDISSVTVPLKDLPFLLKCGCVERIEAYPENVKVLNDTMRMLSKVDDVHLGTAPLPQSYKGKNVLIGYIDSGIDLHHPDFQDSLGNTRVAWLWDMTKPVAANTPQPYGYGQEWSAADIDNGLAISHTGEDEYGHGTYVAGIGSGNGAAVGHFQGVAPESDILVVSYDFAAADTVSRMVHAISYLFEKANLLGKPCVINASLGDYIGSHDGKDLQSQFISYLINAQPGRVVVAAAGNIGLYPFHVGRTSVPNDTTFTWFKFNSGFGAAYVQIFADTADFNLISYAIGVDKILPDFSFRGSTPFANISSTLNSVLTQSVYNGLNRLGVIQTLATVNAGVYELEIFIQPDSANLNWRFTTTGQGHFDSWSFDWEFQNLPSAVTFPPIVNYYLPDTFQTIVTGMACLDNVITVGNYYNTDRHVDVNGTLQISAGDQPGNLAGNSSRGPTRDGRIKPDISAPGHHIISAGVLTQIPGMIAAQPYKVAQGGYHITGGGTSASAPVVAGIAALYLEQNPTYTWQGVKDAILNCAAHDSFTWGPTPNNAWGYGKADAFSTLSVCSFVGINSIQSDSDLLVYPNPSTGLIHVQIPSDKDLFPVRIDVIEPTGRVVKSFLLNDSDPSIDMRNFASGIYWLRYRTNKNETGYSSFVLEVNR